MRPTCSVFIAASLDGFIARPDGGLDWLDAVQSPGEDYGFGEFFSSIDTLVLGRRTYEWALGFGGWPYAGKRVAVLTHRPGEPRHGETFLAGDPAAIVERLGREGARHLYVDGGATIARFLEAGLVDDLTISILPVLLGDGIRLFPGRPPETRLALVESRAFPSGLVRLRYRAGSRPAG
jgi:dihydrofolate reductase